MSIAERCTIAYGYRLMRYLSASSVVNMEKDCLCQNLRDFQHVLTIQRSCASKQRICAFDGLNHISIVTVSLSCRSPTSMQLSCCARRDARLLRTCPFMSK
jgi:hypothetical protein